MISLIYKSTLEQVTLTVNNLIVNIMEEKSKLTENLTPRGEEKEKNLIESSHIEQEEATHKESNSRSNSPDGN